MKKIDFTWPKESFKNFQSIFLISLIFMMLYFKPDLRDAMIISLTLILKHYYDTNTSNSKKDETIASMANSIPDAERKTS
jgi:hypothetical protein